MPQLEQHYLAGSEQPPVGQNWEDEVLGGSSKGKNEVGSIRRRLTGGKKSWRDRKKAGLEIQVYG
jgi:hypothetical protein